MLYNKLLENIILPLGDIALNSSFIKELRKWRKISLMSEKELQFLQAQNLKNTLQYSTKNIPYYRDLQIPEETNPYEWLKKFPILYKSTFKGREKDFTNKEYDRVIENLPALLAISPQVIREAAFRYFDLARGVDDYEKVYKRILGN